MNTPTYTSTPVDTATFTSTPVNTPTYTSTPVNTATFTSTPVNTATYTSTPVNTPTYTSTPVDTATYTSTPVNTPTYTSTPVNTATYTSTPVNTATYTSTPVNTATYTSTPVNTATFTSTPVDTATYTSTPVNTSTPTISPTGTATVPTSTPTTSPTATATVPTATNTPAAYTPCAGGTTYLTLPGGTTTWYSNATYTLACTILVPSGSSLVIQQDVLIKDNGKAIEVTGTLQALGVAGTGQNITMTSSSGSNQGWDGIWLGPNSSGNSLSYLDIQHAGGSISVHGITWQGGLDVDGTSVTLNNVGVQTGNYWGLVVHNGTVTANNSDFSGNTSYGIYVIPGESASSTITLNGCTVDSTSSGQGIYAVVTPVAGVWSSFVLTNTNVNSNAYSGIQASGPISLNVSGGQIESNASGASGGGIQADKFSAGALLTVNNVNMTSNNNYSVHAVGFSPGTVITVTNSTLTNNTNGEPLDLDLNIDLQHSALTPNTVSGNGTNSPYFGNDLVLDSNGTSNGSYTQTLPDLTTSPYNIYSGYGLNDGGGFYYPVIITTGTSITIPAGQTFAERSTAFLEVLGTLIANGTSTSPITFTGSQSSCTTGCSGRLPRLVCHGQPAELRDHLARGQRHHHQRRRQHGRRPRSERPDHHAQSRDAQQ